MPTIDGLTPQQAAAQLNADPVFGRGGTMEVAGRQGYLPDGTPLSALPADQRRQVAGHHSRRSPAATRLRSGPLGVSWLLWLVLAAGGYMVATHQFFQPFRHGAAGRVPPPQRRR